MKTPLLAVLALSLAGNALLAVYVLRDDAASNPSIQAKTSDAPHSTVPGKTGGGDATAGAVPAAAAWSRINPAGDLHEVVANLRAAGFPPSLIRGIVQQMVTERMASQNPRAGQPYWKRHANDKETIDAMRAHSDERQAMIESLLGSDGTFSAGLDPQMREQLYGNLPNAKIDALVQIEKDYSDLQRRAMTSRPAGDIQNMMQQREMLEKEKREDIAALLSSEELEQLDMRQSQSANRVMNNVRNVEVSETEYAALFRLQKALDDANPMSGMGGPESYATRAAAQREMNEQVRALLGEERFDQYLEAADPSYGTVKSFASNHSSVTPEKVSQLYQLQNELQSSMMGNQRVSSDERTRMIAGFNQRLEALLGSEVAAEYRKQGPGRMFAAAGGLIRFGN